MELRRKVSLAASERASPLFCECTSRGQSSLALWLNASNALPADSPDHHLLKRKQAANLAVEGQEGSTRTEDASIPPSAAEVPQSGCGQSEFGTLWIWMCTLAPQHWILSGDEAAMADYQSHSDRKSRARSGRLHDTSPTALKSFPGLARILMHACIAQHLTAS